MGPVPASKADAFENGPSNPLSVLQLMPNGANWVSYERRLVITLGSRGLLHKHLEGRAPKPRAPTPLRPTPTAPEVKAHNKAVKEYDAGLDEWETREYAVMQQIICTIPDSILIRIQNPTTAVDMWNALKADFEGRMQAVRKELRNRLTLTKCGENENVREHVDRMRYMNEELAGMGVAIPDSEYATILIKSMPKSYRNYFVLILVAVEVSGKSLTPTMVMKHAGVRSTPD